MEQNSKQLAVERLKSSINVLVTVSTNPSVDDLSALIGFSLLLGKLDKHASAVFSGVIPPAIQFLQPNQRIAKDVSSLRDFIIALDKNKADKLRYKVEDDVVKIFITPYKTALSKEDLSFSEGDFNVDTVVALGVGKRDDLDNAIKAHGRILHDATVITINCGSKTSDLGVIDWQDPAASSLCEMLVSISESFGSGLLDEQISTAFMTGIVAATDHFSNGKTSPKVMTMAAQLMAAGANQQLISSNINVRLESPAPPPPKDDTQLSIKHETEAPKAPLPSVPPATPPPVEPPPPDKTLQDLESEISDLAGAQPPAPVKPPKPATPSTNDLPSTPANQILSPPSQIRQAKPLMDSYHHDDKPTLISHPKGHGPREVDDNPLLGGTFNATSEQAHEEAVSDLRKSVNSTILSHPGQPLDEDEEPPTERAEAKAPPIMPPTLMPPADPASSPTPAANNGPVDIDEARKAVEAAVNSQPFNPAGNPLQSVGSAPLPNVTTGEIAIDEGGNIQPSPASAPTSNEEFKLPS